MPSVSLHRTPSRRRLGGRAAAAAFLMFVGVFTSATETVAAEPGTAPARSWLQLVTSNGYTGVVVDLERGEIVHFREHIFATEEPQWRPDGTELWEPTVPGGDCFKPRDVRSRDLLADAYFGVAARGTSRWLNTEAVDRDASGYDAPPDRDGRDGGTGIVRMVQPLPDAELTATTRVFAPWGAEWGAFVMTLELHNDGATDTGPLRLYGLVNANLGYGRPGARAEIGADFETIRREPDGAIVEQGFAGTIIVRPVGASTRTSHTPAAFFEAVRDGAGDLPDPPAGPATGTGLASAVQWDVPSLAPGASVWVALVVSHDPNPDYDEGRLAATDLFVGGRTAQQLWSDERTAWQAFQDRVARPAGLSDDERDLYDHSATVLRMAQVRESAYWVRPELDRGVARRTGVDGANALVAAGGQVRAHLGAGAILASLPPGEWAYAWVRDGAYAIAGLTDAGLFAEARAALDFYMAAHANRYIDYGELRGVPLRDYALSLTRYHGFGIEESDTTCNGDLNFEWDGFGLYLWALRHYIEQSGDTGAADVHWSALTERVGDVIIGLVDDTGLMSPDSSIWEVHWFGDEKRFTYTQIAGARGLCDLAWIAEQRGDAGDASRYARAGRALRREIFRQLRNSDGALAANVEELAAGTGYWDAAVIEAVGMGLFDPMGPTASATIAALRDNLSVASGCGLSRNDDAFDAHDLSPYGGDYDTLEWIFLDYRMSIATRLAGLDAYADGLQGWVRDQSLENFLLIAENYDPGTGAYRNNAPMIGFGSGSYITAMRQRAGDLAIPPACGVYFEDDPEFGPDRIEPVDADADAGPDDADVGPDEDVSSMDSEAAEETSGAGDAEDADHTDDAAEIGPDAPDHPTTDAEDVAPADAPGGPDHGGAGGDPELGDLTADTAGAGDGGRDTARAAPSDGGGRGSRCTTAPGSAGAHWVSVLALLILRRRRR